ncbi:M81 family metallopeptidase [Roseibium aggregatum]|uniref:Microcystinase C n=1 Tax=Roseibium aggregatum TaxID=187304 RepID=A0A0M6YBJ6_9HYPH|nr:M81 family metallopeptidase [Roseibium aggregatum]CTQ47452.1 hypothetical protein LAL4801_05914 [Roseibium aggregatum]
MNFRVAMIEYSCESNTFTIKRTGLQRFHASRYYTGSEICEKMRDTGSEIAGCIDVADANSWELVPIVAAQAAPGGAVTEEARKAITNDVLKRLKKADPFDGIFIAFHGAMVTESAQDGETQFLVALRNLIGRKVPIAVTFDLHANIFDEMSMLVDIAVSYRTYPHIDMRELGREACELLQRAMAGEIEPQVAVTRPPMLVGCDDGRTTKDGPMCRILELAEREMAKSGILNVAVNAGFTDADVFAAGPSVLVTYDAKSVPHREALAAAERVCGRVWDYRMEWAVPMALESCIEELESHTPDGDPVIVADFSDNPGSGAYGDCTAVLAALLNASLEDAALGALYDPEAAHSLAKAGIGAERTLSIGGKTDPGVGGGPIQVTGTVIAVSDGSFVHEGPMYTGLPGWLGTCVCLRVQGIDILIVSENVQMFDQNIFRAVGIEPAEKSIVVVKSMQHFRGAFEPIAAKVLVTDAGGLCTPNVTARQYRNIRRPVFPLDAFDG